MKTNGAEVILHHNIGHGDILEDFDRSFYNEIRR